MKIFGESEGSIFCHWIFCFVFVSRQKWSLCFFRKERAI